MGIFEMEARKAQGFFALAVLLITAPLVLSQSTGSDQKSTGVSTYVQPRTTEQGTCSNSTDGNHTCFNCTVAPYCIAVPNGYINAGIVSCADLDASKPYCADGVCGATPAAGCEPNVSTSAFTCTSEGYFPDPDDCQKFHLCVGTEAADYSCSSNYVYSHAKNACIRRAASSDCAVIKCTYKTVVEYVVYPKDSSVYGLCIRGNPTVVFKCREGEQFDTKESKCNFVCKQEGLFPVPDDPRKYRECIYVSSNKFELVERTCPAKSVFDSSKGRCVAEQASP
uniref:Chitin binding peritrophin-A domain containing protein n=1 Tax=Coptotermes formosanus TaxID=36987 RepID=R4UKV7_COPFO|nr:chitin binding peritrophin-A domain containing protein [Coptotermes formosanus]